ncbi:MAG: helix-turn-helix transcriptional regulator, partial [Atopobiaceae bacterium]|nr:helix-turn-helix transcriptional regulator [Atopobiaceae bacterium]
MTNQNRETLGRRIARMRLEHAMTQERLANIANVSAQAVSKWENDQSYPDILLLPLLAKTFDVTVDELLGVEDATERMAPVVEPAPAPEPEATPAPELEPEVALESEPEPASEPEPTPALDIDGPASHLRLRVIRAGRDAVNLTIPLAAARLVTNVASYFPERLIEGVDIAGLFQGAQNAGKGTLVDVDDDHDHVI